MLSQSPSDRQSSTSTPARPLGRRRPGGCAGRGHDRRYGGRVRRDGAGAAAGARRHGRGDGRRARCSAAPRSGRSTVTPSAARSAEDWHRRLRRELIEQSAFLDGLVGGLGTMSSTLDPALVLERATEQAHQLLAPDATVLLVPAADGNGLRPAAARGIGLGPIADVVVETNSVGPLRARRRPGRRRRPQQAAAARPRALTVPHRRGRRAAGPPRPDAAPRHRAVQPGRADPGVGARRLRRDSAPRTPTSSPGSNRSSPRPGCARPSGPTCHAGSCRPSRTSAASSRSSSTTGRSRPCPASR